MEGFQIIISWWRCIAIKLVLLSIDFWHLTTEIQQCQEKTLDQMLYKFSESYSTQPPTEYHCKLWNWVPKSQVVAIVQRLREREIHQTVCSSVPPWIHPFTIYHLQLIILNLLLSVKNLVYKHLHWKGHQALNNARQSKVLNKKSLTFAYHE